MEDEEKETDKLHNKIGQLKEEIKKRETEIDLLKDMLSNKDKEFHEHKSKKDSEIRENAKKISELEKKYKELEEFCHSQFGTTIPTTNISYADFVASSVKHQHPRFVESPQMDDDSHEHQNLLMQNIQAQ